MGDMSRPTTSVTPQRLSSETLKHGWTFKQTDDPDSTSWLPVARVPSTVHQDLIDNGRLADPFVGFNELKAEWVGEKSWTYKTTFRLPPSRHLEDIRRSRVNTRVVLAFDGLDTFATVKVEGQIVLKADNMFLPYRIDVTDIVKAARDNEVLNIETGKQFELEIDFEPALFQAREIKQQHPNHKWIVFNGEPSRLAVRKAQYHWGWDWGPFLMCAGIWRDVRVEVFEARISDLRIDVELSEDLTDCVLSISMETEGWEELNANVSTNLCALITTKRCSDDAIIATKVVEISGAGLLSTQILLEDIELWWPAGYGDQSLSVVTVAIYSAENVELHSVTKRIGLRKVELVQHHDTHGKSFFFRVNNVDIFCGGSCWIPADSILTNIDPKRYRQWLELMVPANQKMIRVWGGGIYEDDAFYDACDELGIMVWQDFMFACGNYPTFPAMLDSIKMEASANMRRLRHHPSIAIVAGNNEDYQVAEQSGLTYNYPDKDESHWLRTDFPARYIYEYLLPQVMALECPSIQYHPGSPWGDGKATSDPTVGDIHQWNVWHGSQQKYQIFATLGGRFNSEFGMEAFPHIDTIHKFVERQEDLYPQSHVIDFHNKADGHERRIATYLVENVRTATDLEAYIHLTQLIQCEALMFGYRGWRKQWGDNRKCGGALVWQLNDCWPVTSWSICDYYLRRKPSYYAMARALAPVAIGIEREHYDWSVTHAREPEVQKWRLWAVSSLQSPVQADIEVRFISVREGSEIRDKIELKDIAISSNGTTDLDHGVVDNINEEPHVLAARIWVNGRVVGRDTDWPQPLKYLHFPERNPKVKFMGDNIHVTADRPVKCLVFEEREGYHLGDSAIDVLPGDEQVIHVKGAKMGDAPLRWTYLGAGEQ